MSCLWFGLFWLPHICQRLLNENIGGHLWFQGGKLSADDVKDELCDTIKADMEVETEPNVYKLYGEYVKQQQPDL